MTVSDLIAALSKLPADLPVYVWTEFDDEVPVDRCEINRVTGQQYGGPRPERVTLGVA